MTKEERRVYDRAYRKAHREERKASKAKYHNAYPEKKRAASAKYREANPQRVKAAKAKYREANLEKEKARLQKWRKANPDRISAHSANHRATKLQATPPWAHHGVINFIYALAQHQGHVVDHIVPLKGKTVCGLHWERNLQLLTAKENSKKGNSLTELASYLAI